jgi:hypothetical protein
MPEDFTDLEAELKQLRPRGLRPEFAAGLGRERADRPRRTTEVVWLWPVLGAVAAFALVAVGWHLFAPVEPLRPSNPSSAFASARPEPQARMVPSKAVNLLYAASDGGIVRFADQTAARKVRLQYIDTITWRDPSGRTSLQCTVPRDEVYFLPVAAY